MGLSKKSDATNQARNILNKRGDSFECFKIHIDAAFLGDKDALQFLGDCFFCGDFGPKDINLAKYIYELVDGKKPKAILQYKEISDLSISALGAEDMSDKEEEAHHLKKTISLIDSRVSHLQNQLDRGFSAYCLEGDIQADFLQKRQEISRLLMLRASPYYGRVDVSNGSGTKIYYIGEENLGIQSDVISVWSSFGRHFRQRFELEFSEMGYHYIVKRRRQIDIEDGELISYVDTYVAEKDIREKAASGVGNGTVFDPFLKKVLERKRGESNVSNIIRSIQDKQNEIIDFDFDRSFIVQGCAGSGKTMILLHRLANLKYNRPETKWSRVKIITPNEQFSTYIDNLSENLGINMIPRRSLTEYYLEIIQRYANDLSSQSGTAFAKSKKQIKPDYELPNDLVCFLYSSRFAKYLQELVRQEKDTTERKIEEVKNKISSNWSENIGKKAQLRDLEADRIEKRSFSERRKKIREFITASIETTLDTFKWPSKDVFYQCLAYAEVLAHYFIAGIPKFTDSLLCIDEGQNISQLQYLLLHRVNGNNVCFNIYGDTGQKMKGNCGIEDWSSLQKFMMEQPDIPTKQKIPLFLLKENYRNSEEIVDFYNARLGKQDKALGIKIGRTVRHIGVDQVEALCKFHWILKNRVAIIGKTVSHIPSSIDSICVRGEVQEGKISVLNIIEAAGLEFDVVLVFDQDMFKEEKYVPIHVA